MNIRRFRSLHAAGATYAEIARECGCDPRTVKKYLAQDAPSTPPVGTPRAGTQPKVIDPFVGVIDAWLRADIAIKGAVIHERLVAEHGFTGSYQRVKMHLGEVRGVVAAELADADENPLRGLHRRFEVVPGAQAQVDWGDEGDVLAHVGVPNVYSFHMTLSHSRDSYTCFTTSMDLASFWDCHRKAFAHFGGIPGAVVYDRTKTVVKRHVAPGLAVPLHPEAAAFAEHYGFTIDVLAAYRPTGKGRVERMVAITREHVITGRTFDSIADLVGAWQAWIPIRRGQVHRTHGQVISVLAAIDRAALGALPDQPYLVTEKHLRRVGKDCLISYEASFYSVPARGIRAGQRVQLQVDGDVVTIRSLAVDGGGWLATHPRAVQRGAWVVDQTHWDGLPDGHTRAVVTEPRPSLADLPAAAITTGQGLEPLSSLLARRHADVSVATRPLTTYTTAALGDAS